MAEAVSDYIGGPAPAGRRPPPRPLPFSSPTPGAPWAPLGARDARAPRPGAAGAPAGVGIGLPRHVQRLDYRAPHAEASALRVCMRTRGGQRRALHPLLQGRGVRAQAAGADCPSTRRALVSLSAPLPPFFRRHGERYRSPCPG
eukprot:1004861-Pyramimonas_sp.AAC.1